jgi:hypothetical protein
MKCFNFDFILNHPYVDAGHPFALDYQTIATAQDQALDLQQNLLPSRNSMRAFQ